MKKVYLDSEMLSPSDKYIKDFVFDKLDKEQEPILPYSDIVIDIIRLWGIENNRHILVNIGTKEYSTNKKWEFDVGIYNEVDMQIISELFRHLRN